MLRTTRKVITFRHPFFLSDAEDLYAAGQYAIETDEELLQDVSFPAYRRVATLMQRIHDTDPKRIMPVETIDPLLLDAAIMRDAQTCEAPLRDTPAAQR